MNGFTPMLCWLFHALPYLLALAVSAGLTVQDLATEDTP
jgi:hypothetical protein